MDEQPKNKHSKFARMFVDFNKLEKPERGSYDGASVSEKIEYVVKVFFVITLLLFSIPLLLVALGVGGPELKYIGWISVAMFPIVVILGIASAISKTFKK